MRYLTIADMRELHISSVNLVKEETSSVEHEYISVTIQGQNKQVAYICFERNRGDERREARLARARRLDHYGLNSHSPSTSSSFHVGNTSSPFSIASLDSTKNSYRAQDVVTLTVDTRKHPFDTVAHILQCPRDMEPLYLYELAVLAKTLHNTSIEYKLFSKNCYWYAGVLFELLEQRLKLKATPGERRNGRWGRLSIYKQESAKDLARVMEQFVRNLAAFEHEVRERESNWRRQQETEQEIEELKREVQRLKDRVSIPGQSQVSGSVTGQRQTREAFYCEAVQQENEVRRLAEKVEEEQRRADEERQWKREERRLKEEERRLREAEHLQKEQERREKEEERRLKELAEQRAVEAERVNEEKDKELRLLLAQLEGLQPLLELLPRLGPEHYGVAGLSTA